MSSELVDREERPKKIEKIKDRKFHKRIIFKDIRNLNPWIQIFYQILNHEIIKKIK